MTVAMMIVVEIVMVVIAAVVVLVVARRTAASSVVMVVVNTGPSSFLFLVVTVVLVDNTPTVAVFGKGGIFGVELGELVHQIFQLGALFFDEETVGFFGELLFISVTQRSFRLDQLSANRLKLKLLFLTQYNIYIYIYMGKKR